MSNRIVVKINESCNLLECAFQEGVSTELFAKFQQILGSLPGYTICYGTNMREGGCDRSLLNIGYNLAEEPEEASMKLRDLLSLLGYKEVIWKRDIIGASLKSKVLEEVLK